MVLCFKHLYARIKMTMINAVAAPLVTTAIRHDEGNSGTWGFWLLVVVVVVVAVVVVPAGLAVLFVLPVCEVGAALVPRPEGLVMTNMC